MPFLSPNQHCQSTEGKSTEGKFYCIYFWHHKTILHKKCNCCCIKLIRLLWLVLNIWYNIQCMYNDMYLAKPLQEL